MKEIEEESSENDEIIEIAELSESEENEIGGGRNYKYWWGSYTCNNKGFDLNFEMMGKGGKLIIRNTATKIQIINITSWSPKSNYVKVYNKGHYIEIICDNSDIILDNCGISFMYIDRRTNITKNENIRIRFNTDKKY